MDDILASIRKIISDDEARAQFGDSAVRPEQPGTEPQPAVPPVAAARRDDVLLLTDLIEEPPRKASEIQTTSIPLNDPVSPNMPQQSNDSSEPLIGSSVAGATSSAFDRLTQAVQDSVPPPSAAEPGPALGTAGKTIEEMVKDMLRPMLKEWLDRNLPPIVERYVEREIVRLTRR
jgi:cell pole-organizing protein PopZ